MVLGISKGEVGGDTDTVTDIVVERDTRRETVQLLLDDRTCLVIETTTDTEGSFLTTSGYRDVMVLAQTGLLDCLDPVGIVVILLILREGRIIVDLLDSLRARIALCRVEVSPP